MDSEFRDLLVIEELSFSKLYTGGREPIPYNQLKHTQTLTMLLRTRPRYSVWLSSPRERLYLQQFQKQSGGSASTATPIPRCPSFGGEALGTEVLWLLGFHSRSSWGFPRIGTGFQIVSVGLATVISGMCTDLAERGNMMSIPVLNESSMEHWFQIFCWHAGRRFRKQCQSWLFANTLCLFW